MTMVAGVIEELGCDVRHQGARASAADGVEELDRRGAGVRWRKSDREETSCRRFTNTWEKPFFAHTFVNT
jgi:hypothetical protein